MDGIKVELIQMLDARDERYRLQQKLLTEYKRTLISFTMNIAGPIKNNPLIRWAFDYGRELLEGSLTAHKIPIVYQKTLSEVTGNEAFFVVSDTAEQVKRIAMQIEDHLPIGRLFDIDVLDFEGNHLDRVGLGGKLRTCLICQKPAKECGRSRAHSVEELQNKTEALLLDFRKEVLAEEIAGLAVKSLLFEVATTPKPGLVDLHDNGSHKDMDVFTFLSSSSVLHSYFQQCVKEGILAKRRDLSSNDLFERLRYEGILAETKMKRATAGVNTHKGAIFSMGILCGAIGKMYADQDLFQRDQADPSLQKAWLKAEIRTITRGLTESLQELEDGKLTNGLKLYKAYGIRGARGEAEDGFPTVFDLGLPMLERCLQSGMSLNEAGVQTLLELLSHTIDTNMVARSDRETAKEMQRKIRSLRNQQGFWEKDVMEALNQEFIQKNLSPGGSADLLSLTYFLYDFFRCGEEV